MKKRDNRLKQQICKHKNCKINHITKGHWRGNDYVGGDIYILECKDCLLEIDKISNRWDSEWNILDLTKLQLWRNKYK